MNTAVTTHMADVRPTQTLVRPSRWARVFGLLWRWTLGTLLCLTPLTAVLVLGWLLRFTERAVLRRWFVLAGGSPRRGGFEDFMLLSPGTVHLARWPNWIVHELGRSAPVEGGRARAVLTVVFGAGWANLRAGVATIVNVWLVTLPPAALWILAWWGGWENSFNKGYEQHWVGPAVFIFGTVLFALVMIYLPLAQARHAVTGDWRAFYDYPVIRTLARQRWYSCLGLAVLFAVAALPIMGLKVLPLRLDRFVGDYATLGAAELREIGGRYFLGATAVLFAALILLRGAIARVYAGAMVDAIRDGSLSQDQLGARERAVFERLHLFHDEPRPRRHAAIRMAAWLGTRTARLAGFALSLAVWGVFVFELVAAQFLNHAWINWINHPLIQLPWLWQGPI